MSRNKFYFKIENYDNRILPVNGGLMPRLYSLQYSEENIKNDKGFVCGRWYDLDDFLTNDQRDKIMWSGRIRTVACYDTRPARSIQFNAIRLIIYSNKNETGSITEQPIYEIQGGKGYKSDDENDNGYWFTPFGVVGGAYNYDLREDTENTNSYYCVIQYCDENGAINQEYEPAQLLYNFTKNGGFSFVVKEAHGEWQRKPNGFNVTPQTNVTFTNTGSNNLICTQNGKQLFDIKAKDTATIYTDINGVYNFTDKNESTTQPTQPTTPDKPTQPTQKPTEPTEPPKTQNNYLTLPKLPTGVDSITVDYQNVNKLKYGSDTNCIVTLNHDYRFKDNNNYGNGLIYTDANGQTFVLGRIWGVSKNSDNDYICHLQIDLSKIYDDTVINNLRYDFNIEKYIHNNDKGGVIPITAILKHCTINPQKVAENDETAVTITADDGYILDSDITYYSYNQNYVSYIKLTQKVQKQKNVTININASSLYDYQNTTSHNYNNEPVIIATATLNGSKPTGQANGKLYNISDGQLQSVMNTVIEEWKNSGSDSNEEAYDFTQFVNQVYKIPFNVPENIQKHVTSILAGNTTVKADANEITNSIFNVSCGTIKVPLHYHNAHDYEALKVILNLPYLKEVSLNADDVINQSININYQLDLNSGLITVLISNDNGNIYSQQQNIKTDLSTYAINYNRIVSRPSSIFLNDIRQAYILITYRKPLLNLKTYQTNETGKLKDFRGLTKANNAKIDFNINQWEQNELNSILNNGVFINDIASD